VCIFVSQDYIIGLTRMIKKAYESAVMYNLKHVNASIYEQGLTFIKNNITVYHIIFEVRNIVLSFMIIIISSSF